MVRKNRPARKPRRDKNLDEKSAEELAAEHGVKAVQDIADLRADFWPADENIDEFLKAVRKWRQEGR